VKAEPDPRYPFYQRKIPRTWWLKNGPFRRFAAREFTSMFAAAFSILLLLFLFALSRGQTAYEGFLRWLDGPVAIAISAVILVAVLYHTATWFRLSTRIIQIRVRGKVLPSAVVLAALVAAWIGASAIVLYFLVWF
jgi:fumarate reductase subunit C